METILVVDDDQLYIDHLKSHLEGCGYEVVPAGSVAEAWLRLQGARIDLILADIGLPGEDGLGLARRVRADAELCVLPIVFLSGIPGPEVRARAFEVGADDLVGKPCDLADLLARIRAQLRQRARYDRIDAGLARIEQIVRERDELLALIVNDFGAIVTALRSELRKAAEAAPGSRPESLSRADRQAVRLERSIDELRIRHGWRPLDRLAQLRQPNPAVDPGPECAARA